MYPTLTIIAMSSLKLKLLCNLLLVITVMDILSSYATSHDVPVKTLDSATTAEAEALLQWNDNLQNSTLSQDSSGNDLLASNSSLASSNSSSNLKWSRSSISHRCNWAGITCDNSGSITQIMLGFRGLIGTLDKLNFSSFPNLLVLDLSDNLLYGTIPSHIGNLSKLTLLDLSGNFFSGNIPPQIGFLSSVRHLFLEYNEFNGSIPQQIATLESLKIVSFSVNKLTGLIPATIANLTKLTHLSLSENKLSEFIPQEISMLKSLQFLALDNNSLSGPIPDSISELRNLNYLYLYHNFLSGSIPKDISKLRHLTELDLSTNYLNGSIPETIGYLSDLTLLYLYANNFSGAIPSSIGNLTKLAQLQLSMNQLSGSIPPEIGNLKFLVDLRLFMNRLTGTIPQQMQNFTTLKALLLGVNMLSGYIPKNVCFGGVLRVLDVDENNFEGPIPESLKNCTSLVRARLERNQLTGNISEYFGVYPHLYYLDLSHNNLHGMLSPNLRYCQNLTYFSISNNRISGRIPPELGKAARLQVLDLSSNYLVGEIPQEVTRLSLLFTLELNDNKLSGYIPKELGTLSRLSCLNLAANNFSGMLPQELGNCSNLLSLNLSNTRINGDIPFQIGSLCSLESLDLSHNLLKGEVPLELGQLIRLEMLNLSHNELSGSIPFTFGGMLSLTEVDISNNQFSGPLPNSKAFSKAPPKALANNKGLCGNNTALNSCRKSRQRDTNIVVILAMVSVLGTLLLCLIGGVLFIICRRTRKDELGSRRSRKNDPNEAEGNNIFAVWNFEGKMVHRDIIEATEEFSCKYCIGVGGSGSVYKAELQTGLVVAVKKFHPLEDGEVANPKGFANEIRVLTEIRHRNIVKLYGFCSHARYSYLVYEFLAAGSLKQILSDEERAKDFKWNHRINVVKGVAKGLSFMHHDCFPSIVHRDISSNNILLDSEYEAHISDFGTSKILQPDSLNWASFAGTFGYLAPELAYTMAANEKSDVYSFGLVSLEAIMGKNPGDLISDLSSSSAACNILLKDVLDQRLPPPRDHVAKEVFMVAKLASACLHANPQSRPTMEQVSKKLQTTTGTPLSETFGNVTLAQLFDFHVLTS